MANLVEWTASWARLPNDKKIEVINWAAEQENMSYGKFVQGHTAEDMNEIYAKYRKYIKDKAKAMEERSALAKQNNSTAEKPTAYFRTRAVPHERRTK